MGRLYIYLHERLIFMVNAGKYTIHGSYGYLLLMFQSHIWAMPTARHFQLGTRPSWSKKVCASAAPHQSSRTWPCGTNFPSGTPQKTNMTSWKIPILNRKYIFRGSISSAILVYRSVGQISWMFGCLKGMNLAICFDSWQWQWQVNPKGFHMSP